MSENGKTRTKDERKWYFDKHCPPFSTLRRPVSSLCPRIPETVLTETRKGNEQAVGPGGRPGTTSKHTTAGRSGSSRPFLCPAGSQHLLNSRFQCPAAYPQLPFHTSHERGVTGCVGFLRVVGGAGPIVSGFMFMLEVQGKWYVTTLALPHLSTSNRTETISIYRALERG
jgi:hypothetical protein